jgi:hypothetical protein
MTARLILNAMRTPDGTVLVSRTRHDCVTYQDANGKTYMLDGGTDYVRGMFHGDEVNMSLLDNQPHEVQRWVLVWGTYGKDGKQPLTHKPIALMDTGHLEAVLRDCFPSTILANAMKKELEMRGVIENDNKV